MGTEGAVGFFFGLPPVQRLIGFPEVPMVRNMGGVWSQSCVSQSRSHTSRFAAALRSCQSHHGQKYFHPHHQAPSITSQLVDPWYPVLSRSAGLACSSGRRQEKDRKGRNGTTLTRSMSNSRNSSGSFTSATSGNNNRGGSGNGGERGRFDRFIYNYDIKRPDNETTLIQALDVEARHNFSNMKGKRYASFHEFLLHELSAYGSYVSSLEEAREFWQHGDQSASSQRDRMMREVSKQVQLYPTMGRNGRRSVHDQVRELLQCHNKCSNFDPEFGLKGVLRKATLSDMEPFNLFFFDLETTGLSHHKDRVVEIAITALHSGERWSCLVDPECRISRQASEVTGLTNEMLQNQGARPFRQVVQSLVEFVEEQSLYDQITLIAHNVKFDSRFLNAEFDRAGRAIPEGWYFYDSMQFARKVLGKGSVNSFGLQNLNRHFSLPPPEEAHRAMADVDVLLGVFECLIGKTSPDQVVKLIHNDRFSTNPNVSINVSPNVPTSNTDTNDRFSGSTDTSINVSPNASTLNTDTNDRFSGNIDTSINASTLNTDTNTDTSINASTLNTDTNDRSSGNTDISVNDPTLKGEIIGPIIDDNDVFSATFANINYNANARSPNRKKRVPRSPRTNRRRTLEESPAEQKLSQKQIEFLTTGIPMNDLKDFTTLQKQSNSEAGFDTLVSLLQHYPRDYLLYSPTAFQDGEFICSQGAVESITSFCKGYRGFINAVVEINDMKYGMHTVHIKQWLHFRNMSLAQRALKGIASKYPVGSLMAFKGKLKQRGRSENTWDLTGKVEMTPLDEFVKFEQEIIPVYPQRGSLKSAYFNKAMVKAVANFDRIVEQEGECRELELLPLDVVQKYGLMSFRDAIRAIHFPATTEEAEKARKRLVFQELYLLQSALMLRRYQLQTPRNNVDAKGISVSGSELLNRAVENLPYQLTSAQARVLDEVITDMSGAPPMMRLLQGDVGSGKTIVAMLAMLSVVDSGWQCAFMVPTEILATQHAQKLEEFLNLLRLNDSTFNVPKVLLLTGSMKASEKREVLEATSDGSASITIGTHALISEGVQFKKLGLAVIDEQHKFGVEQRSKLQSKNEPPPHLLSMSATPIPRTLALTMYGEMSLSYIDEPPPGRKPVETRVHKQSNAALRSQAYEKMVTEVKLGNKGFVVFPLIDESESEDFQAIKAAEASFHDLERNELKGVSCGLLHGRLQAQEKIEAQDAFIEGKTQVLMATAVIEVGVDIPEATVIIVENAERFGLAQLHQLRGRVGRSQKQSYCFFLTGGNDASHSRIKHMERLNNGFAVSEVDMALRGPGEFLGTKQAGQSGLPSLQLTDMKSEEDKLTLEDAREAAAHAFSNHNEPNLQQSVLLQLQNQPPIPFLDIAPESIQAFE